MNKKNKWREGLPEIDWQNPEYIIKVNQALNAPPISYLNESQIDLPQTGNKTVIAKWASDIFYKQGNMAINPIIGEVLLDKKSAERSLGHGGFSKYKNLAFLSIKDVVEQGIIIAVDDNQKLERSYFISAPIYINSQDNNGDRIVTVLIHKDANLQKMYLHSVIEKERLLKPLQCRTDQIQKVSRHPTSLTSADVHNILHQALIVNIGKTLNQNINTYNQSQEKTIDLQGLSPREVGRKIFESLDGKIKENISLIEKSLDIHNLKIEKSALEQIEGKHPLQAKDIFMKSIRIKNIYQNNQKDKDILR